MITIKEKLLVNGDVELIASHKNLKCKIESTFYKSESKLGSWIGGGDDWSENFEFCDTLKMAKELVLKDIKQFALFAESNL